MTVTTKEFNVKIKGFEYIHNRDKSLFRKAKDLINNTYTPIDLYEVSIKRDDSTFEKEDFLV